ncbi:MAG: GAF domain-containing protein [Acidobacteria bacterium]|nr:GAF domain-containing protein [Acidobacteriota bacterium]
MIEQSATKGKPPLDEESFTRLLAAAYVMQEHQDQVRSKVTPADLTQIIAQVVETQNEIQNHSLNRDAAFDLIARRLSSLTGAAGVAIATIKGENLRYRAGTGSAVAPLGTEVPRETSFASSCLRTGTAFQSPLAETDPRLNSAECRKVRAQSLLAVPLYQDGHVSGSIEMYFYQVSGFGESETRAAELMAEVASEVMASGAEQEIRNELDLERASVLQALEMLGPELQRISGQKTEASAPLAARSESESCRACGHALQRNQTSCSACGAARATEIFPSAALQGKWAVLWERHLAGGGQNGMPLFRKPPQEETVVSSEELETSLEEEEPDENHSSEEPWKPGAEFDSASEGSTLLAEAGGPRTSIEVSPWVDEPESQEPPSTKFPENPWRARLERLKARPGDASLVLGALVLVMTLIWAFWSRPENAPSANAQPPAVTAVKRRPRPKPPKLSVLEQVLVGLGLAVPPPMPQYLGDPNVKVWEDLQTALYYCPDAELYGNTAKGRYTTQAEAQQDAFDPALRKPCD